MGALIAAPRARATENGQSAFATGVNTVLPAIHPQPGELRYFNYLLDYNAAETTTYAGASALPSFKLHNQVNAARVLYTYKPTWNHFSLTSGFIIPVINSHVDANGRLGHMTALGDASIQNFVNWNTPAKTLYLSGGLDVFFPTGRYNPTRLVNTSLNKVTFAPEGDITWFVSKELELSTSTVFEASTVNPTTHYASGDDQETDFAVMFTHPKLLWAHVGLNGFYYQQLSLDRHQGVIVPNSDKQEIVALGPQFRFDFGRAGIAIKYQHEMDAHGKPEGERVWFQFTVPLSPQTRTAPPQAPASTK